VSDSSVLGKFKAVSIYRRQVRSGKKVGPMDGGSSTAGERQDWEWRGPVLKVR